jgi:Flp pilus assembly protein TadG
MPKARREHGVAAVEFALLLPGLMMLMLGIVEFSQAFLIQGSVANAARVGVRNYAINWAVPGSQPAAIDLAKANTPNATQVVSAAFSTACTPGGQTTLTLTYRYRSLTGWFESILGNDVTVQGVGSMQCGG